MLFWGAVIYLSAIVFGLALWVASRLARKFNPAPNGDQNDMKNNPWAFMDFYD